MKPVLIVEGKRQNIVGLGYTNGVVTAVNVVDKSGTFKTFKDAKAVSHYTEENLLVDFNECFDWENKFAPTIEAIEKRIEAYEERLFEVTQSYMEYTLNEDVPFPERMPKAIQLQIEYRELLTEIEKLYEAKNIVFELEGGEKNE